MTDFEMHAYKQRYGEVHLRPVNSVSHLFGDVDLDVGHCKLKASDGGNLWKGKSPLRTRESSQVQECQLEVIKMTNKLDKPQVEAEAMASRAHELNHTILPGKTQGTYRDRIKCKEHFSEILRELSKDKQ